MRTPNKRGVSKISDFQPNEAPYLRNGAKYGQSFYWSLIENSINVFNCYQNQRPGMTLNGRIYTALYCMRLSKLITEIWKKDHPRQRQKCTQRLLLGSIRFVWIFVEIRWWGAGWSELAILSNFGMRVDLSPRLGGTHSGQSTPTTVLSVSFTFILAPRNGV